MEWYTVLVVLIVAMFILLASGLWIGAALGLVGVLALLMTDPKLLGGIEAICWNTINSFILTAIPLFLFMGSIILESGISIRFYKAIAAWLDYLPGSLVHSNIVSCSLFAAVSGSSIATAATLGSVAIPEMRSRGYDRKFGFGSLAAGGTLGILIPPSIALIIYGAMWGQSVGRLFIAGIIPGICLSITFMIYILLRTAVNPRLVPRMEARASWRYRFTSTKDIMPLAVLILIVLGGIYSGLMTPTEAAAVGCAISLIIAAIYRQLNFRVLKASLMQSVKMNAMIIFITIGALTMSFGLVSAGIPRSIVSFISSMEISRWMVFGFICLMYLILGCFVDALSCQLLTLPVVFPVISALGFDPIWFGIVMVLLLEIGLITPPVGMNLFVIQGIAGASLGEVAEGSLPYVVIMLLWIAILALFPILALWLPSYMI